MKVIDASSIVLAWDLYPIDQFSTFWDWVESILKSQEVVMADPNFEEVGNVSPDCKLWLAPNLNRLPVSNAVIGEALKINRALGIVNDNYHPKGVDENDIFCIAAAKIAGRQVICDEAIQASKPAEKRKYKIPATCALPQVAVPCTNLNRYIRQSGVKF